MMIKLLVFLAILIVCLIDIIIVVSVLKISKESEEQEELSLDDYSKKMMDEGMDPLEYVDIYNKYIEEENPVDENGFRPHEHI